MTAPPSLLAAAEDRGFEVASLAVWETEESDRSLASWRQLAVFEMQGGGGGNSVIA